uniref:MAM domain-containing protein n=1 Tax=Mastacembelus armatus TaxID=205130 RepID=A0A3Q3KLB2_9TELE
TWSRITGMSQPANSSGPATDHTLGTQQGLQPVGSKGAIMTAVMEPTPPDGECLMFWYYMEGSGVGELSVYLQTPNTHRDPIQLWNRSGDQGKHWRHGRVTLFSPGASYQVIFEAVVGDGLMKLDDISLRDGACSPLGSCDFESGQCSWVNIHKENGHDWVLANGGYQGPPTDHTTQSPEGWYIAVESDQGAQMSPAALQSPTMKQASATCTLHFYYNMYGEGMFYMCAAIKKSCSLHMHVSMCVSFTLYAVSGTEKLNVLVKEGSRTTTLWWLSGNNGDLWQHGEVMIGRIPQDFTVLFESSRTFSSPGHIAIDDINFTNCILPDLCDFEEGSCNWQQNTTDDFDWVRQSGSSHRPNTGPDSDHTTNTPTGHYYYLPSSAADHTGQTAAMSSPLYPAGKVASTFSSVAGPTQEGDMAFDDVQLTDDHCPPFGFCDFESNMCSWSNLGAEVDQGDWLHGRAASPNPNTGPSVDHTTNSTHGQYIDIMFLGLCVSRSENCTTVPL